MKIAIATLLALLVPSLVEASTSCTTRRSGSVEIVSCSSSGHKSAIDNVPKLLERPGQEDDLQLTPAPTRGLSIGQCPGAGATIRG